MDWNIYIYIYIRKVNELVNNYALIHDLQLLVGPGWKETFIMATPHENVPPANLEVCDQLSISYN